MIYIWRTHRRRGVAHLHGFNKVLGGLSLFLPLLTLMIASTCLAASANDRGCSVCLLRHIRRFPVQRTLHALGFHRLFTEVRNAFAFNAHAVVDSRLRVLQKRENGDQKACESCRVRRGQGRCRGSAFGSRFCLNRTSRRTVLSGMDDLLASIQNTAVDDLLASARLARCRRLIEQCHSLRLATEVADRCFRPHDG